jgi:hypothetical protein
MPAQRPIPRDGAQKSAPGNQRACSGRPNVYHAGCGCLPYLVGAPCFMPRTQPCQINEHQEREGPASGCRRCPSWEAPHRQAVRREQERRGRTNLRRQRADHATLPRLPLWTISSGFGLSARSMMSVASATRSSASITRCALRLRSRQSGAGCGFGDHCRRDASRQKSRCDHFGSAASRPICQTVPLALACACSREDRSVMPLRCNEACSRQQVVTFQIQFRRHF